MRRRLNFFEVLCWAFVLLTPATAFPVAIVPLALMALTWPYLLAVHRRGAIPRPVAWLFVLALYQLLSALFMGMPVSNLAVFEFYRRDAKFLIAYLPFTLVALAPPEDAVASRMLKSLAVLSSCIAFAGAVEYGLAMLGLHLNLMVHSFRHELSFTGLGTSHNAAGSFFAVIVFLVYGQVLSGQWRGARWWLVVLLLELAVFLTLSRSFIVASVVVFGFLTVLYGNRRYFVRAALVSLLVVPFVGAGLGKRFVELRNPDDVRNFTQREEYWSRAISYIEASPFVGIGFSRFNDISYEPLGGYPGLVAWKVGATVENNDDHAHDALLMVWAETGIVGVLIWVGFLGSVLTRARRAYRGVDNPAAMRGLGFGVFGAFLVLLVASIVAFNITTPTGLWPAGFFAGVLIAHRGGRARRSIALTDGQLAAANRS